MKSSVKEKQAPTKRKNMLFVCLAVIIAVIAVAIFYVYNYSFLSPRNYAAEVAKPLEDGLVKAGGVKKSSSGNNGRGTDNTAPYYDSILELSGDRETAAVLVKKVASDNGYSLSHASTDNRGHLGAVADLYIANWYFDTTQKTSPYADLNSGTIQLAFQFGDDNKPDPQGHVDVRISVQLPSFKR